MYIIHIKTYGQIYRNFSDVIFFMKIPNPFCFVGFQGPLTDLHEKVPISFLSCVIFNSI